jgi:predicted metal-binding protein
LYKCSYILPVIVQIDHSVRGLCVKEYPNHPKGCPNFGKKKGCPPSAELFDEVYDLSKPVFAIINKFDFKSHTDKMRKLHPEWSNRQVECCLYWQPSARKELLKHIKHFKEEHREYTIEPCPEAMGVNITETMKKAGIILEWPPETVTYQIALAGIRI